jgi:hypothetical protein
MHRTSRKAQRHFAIGMGSKTQEGRLPGSAIRLIQLNAPCLGPPRVKTLSDAPATRWPCSPKEQAMGRLVVDFSRRGHSRQVAQEVARLCGADLEKINPRGTTQRWCIGLLAVGVGRGDPCRAAHWALGQRPVGIRHRGHRHAHLDRAIGACCARLCETTGIAIASSGLFQHRRRQRRHQGFRPAGPAVRQDPGGDPDRDPNAVVSAIARQRAEPFRGSGSRMNPFARRSGWAPSPAFDRERHCLGDAP